MVIVVSQTFKMAVSHINTKITECFDEYLVNSDHCTPEPSFYKSSCTGLKGVPLPESDITIPYCEEKPVIANEKEVSLSNRGGYTCCVPGCYNNSKKNKELQFHGFPTGESKEKKQLRKKWIRWICRENFSPGPHHRVCSYTSQVARKLT